MTLKLVSIAAFGRLSSVTCNRYQSNSHSIISLSINNLPYSSHRIPPTPPQVLRRRRRRQSGRAHTRLSRASTPREAPRLRAEKNSYRFGKLFDGYRIMYRITKTINIPYRMPMYTEEVFDVLNQGKLSLYRT